MDEKELNLLKESIKNLGDSLKQSHEKQLTGEAVKKQIEESINPINEALKQLKDVGKEDQFKEISNQLDSVLEENKKNSEILLKQGQDLDKLNKAGSQMIESAQLKSKKAMIRKALGDLFNSESYKEFEKKGFKGQVDDFEVKAVVGLGANNSAEYPITEWRGDKVRDDNPARTIHVRDLIPSRNTDKAQIQGPEVYDYTDTVTDGSIILAENGEAPESSFKTRDQTWGTKRIAVSLRLSKRWLKFNGMEWAVNYILQRMPNTLQTVEDFQLLYGDGQGDNVQGLTGQASSLNLTKKTYAASAFASVATYDSGAKSLITFASAHEAYNGQKITIADSVAYNGTYTVIVVNETQIVIEKAYTAEADTSPWTGTLRSSWYQSLIDPQQYDTLIVAASELETAEFSATAAILNNVDVLKMGLIKATDGQYVGVARNAAGEMVVGVLKLGTTNAMPSGRFIVGDFSRGLEIADNTPLTITAYEDVDTGKKNEIVFVAEEEFIFPIYNPLWFIYGDFDQAITDLTKP